MKNKKGFTLIETIVSIGIVVILSTTLTVSVSTYINKAQSASNQVSAREDKYDVARADVKALEAFGVGPGGVTVSPTPSPTTGGGGTPAPTAPPTVPPTVSPSPSPSPSPTVAPPPSYPGTTTTVTAVSGNPNYNYTVVSKIPRDNQNTQYVTITFTPGAVVYQVDGCTIMSFSNTQVVVSIPRRDTDTDLDIRFSGGSFFAVVTNVSRTYTPVS